jgi:hypothetical protein
MLAAGVDAHERGSVWRQPIVELMRLIDGGERLPAQVDQSEAGDRVTLMDENSRTAAITCESCGFSSLPGCREPNQRFKFSAFADA